MINCYLANQFGFHEYGRILLNDIIVPELEKIELNVYEPFKVAETVMDMDYIMSAPEFDERVKRWSEFNNIIGPMNKGLMKNSQMMIPLLDGSYAVDDGVSSEIGHYAAKEYGKIIALRTDFRLADNLGGIINCQIESDIRDSKGMICTKIEEWYNEIKKEFQKLTSS